MERSASAAEKGTDMKGSSAFGDNLAQYYPGEVVVISIELLAIAGSRGYMDSIVLLCPVSFT
jgi:hypothetical protein